MNDSTVIKPRPGARSALPRSAHQTGAVDQTILASAQAGDVVTATGFRLPETQLGPVCDSASRLLSLANRLTRTQAVESLSELRRQCMGLIREYRDTLREHEQSPETIDVASYCICALLDEIVLNTEWGGQGGHWAAQSMLSEFHSQTWSGTHFFELVDKARRTGNMQLMMLQYLCLSLGFRGRYRVEARGDEQIDILRDCLYHEICADQGRFSTPFDRQWEARVTQGKGLAHGVPLWAGAAICGVVLLLIYLGLTQHLRALAQPVLAELNGLGIPERLESVGPGNPDEARYLRQILQTEIDRGLIELETGASGTRLRMGNEALFDSGGDSIREDMVPVVSKIARALESTTGSILVTGHTDDRPISTARFPSNWHLSLARATSVSDLLARNGDLSGRLWPEGRGEADPLFDNDTAENRARNRRVEIAILTGN